MKPGVSRALIGGLLGYIVGAAIVIGLRIAFNFTPYWNLGLILVLGTFTMIYGVIWGVGGFNPRMSDHPDDSIPEPTPEEKVEQSSWFAVITNITWRMWAFALLIMFGFIALALVPGFGLTITQVADASPRLFGSAELQLGEEIIPINQVWLLIAFMAFTMLSLAIAAAVLAGVFYGLSDQVAKANAIPESDPQTRVQKPNRLTQRAGGIAGRLAEAITPKDDKETTAVVVREDN